MLRVLRESRTPMDDDQIASAARMNRVYVNVICRQLAEDRFIARAPGAAGKIVNQATDGGDDTSLTAVPVAAVRRTRRKPSDRLAERTEELVSGFAGYVAAFEASEAFPGPSLYFHERAIERRRRHQAVTSLLDDERFLEYAYAVLPAWGMHRMGARVPTKVGEFADIVSALRQKAPELRRLWPLRLTAMSEDAARQAAVTAGMSSRTSR